MPFNIGPLEFFILMVFFLPGIAIALFLSGTRRKRNATKSPDPGLAKPRYRPPSDRSQP